MCDELMSNTVIRFLNSEKIYKNILLSSNIP